MILLARAIWAGKGNIIMNGAVQVCDNVLGVVDCSKQISPLTDEPIIDLGDSIILPAFVNSHCHLDYTGLAGRLKPGHSFTDWINQIIEVKRSLSGQEQELSWLEGAEMMIKSGCGVVFNIESVPGLFSRVIKQTPLKVCPFTELIGYDDLDNESLVDLAKHEFSLNSPLAMVTGLAPHSPYTTTANGLNALSEYANSEAMPITIHVSESVDEWDMFTSCSGPLFDKMKSLGRIMNDCGIQSPIQHLNNLEKTALRTLVVHANFLINEDFDFLSNPKMSVVHCPKSHSWFGYPEFKYKDLAKRGVNICLGTDSLASSGSTEMEFGELNIFSEMREFKLKNPEIDIGDILEMATCNGAKAIGLDHRFGQLREEMLANFSVIPFPKKLSNVEEAIIAHKGSVSGLFIDGKQVYSGKT